MIVYNKQYWNHAEKSFNAPKLLQVFRKEIDNKTIDFYRGNDVSLDQRFSGHGRSDPTRHAVE